jgi:type VI secretion system protein ImpD
MNPSSPTTTPLDEPIFREAAPAVDSAAAPEPAAAPGSSLLDAVLAATDRAAAPRFALEQFLAEPSPVHALGMWLGQARLDGAALPKDRIAARLSRDIARLDALLTRQVNAILHHPAFQKLEASWRGLDYLVRQVPETANVKIRVLSASWKELVRDLERAIEFDQSQLFRKVYEHEFGRPGGEPFGLLLGDYEIHPRPSSQYPTDDLDALRAIASVAAASFAPFITAAHPSLLDMDSFADLGRASNLSAPFERLEYLKWRSLREAEDSRFVGVTLPHMLMRRPYAESTTRADGFRFHEQAGAPDRSGYLWANAVYAFGAVVVRAYAETGWLANIRGAQRGLEAGGLVTGLPAQSFSTDRPGIAPKCVTDVIITDAQEKELAELGFIPLSHCQDTEWAAFYSNQSVQKPKDYDEPAATANARVSAMLQYMLCVSRFAHYIKVLSRDWIGSFTGPADCEDRLRRWLMQYTSGSDKGGQDLRAQYPLREARVKVSEHPRNPGAYQCEVHLRPHYQLDQLVAAVRLVTELASPSAE